MGTATLSTKGQLVIPHRYRQALHLRAGDRVALALEGEQLVLRRDAPGRATLALDHGRHVLVAPPGSPKMTTAGVKAALADFP
jgi:AbrB family looped-hinge helix DNA binding protein